MKQKIHSVCNRMKEAICLLLLSILVLLPEKTQAVQEQQAFLRSNTELISLEIENKSTEEVLKELERLTGYSFLYLNNKMPLDKRHSFKIIKQPLRTVLGKILDPLQIEYKIVDKQIILNIPSASKKSSVEEASISAISPQLLAGVRLEIREFPVKGRVISSENDEALPGVSIVIKGTTIGTTTDADGNYSLSVPDEGAILTFSYIGFTSEDVPVNNRTIINVSLVPDIESLQEVVVVGYGTQREKDVTGAISKIKGEDMAQVAASSFDQQLQGRAAGVQVSQSSGAPGAPVRVLIRGTSSLSAGTEPLYIVDGFPIFQNLNGIQGNLNPLASINPSDIESVEILKDAAATAIYGSRGANGVIIVTTKSGKKGKGYTTLDYSYGMSEPTNMVKLTDAQTWLRLTDEGWANDGQTTTWDPNNNGGLLSNHEDDSELTRAIAEDVVANGGTNWLKPILRDGVVQQFNLSTARGFENGQFFISGNYRDEQGILVGQNFKRYGIRANIDFSPIKNLNTGLRTNLTHIKQDETAQIGTGGSSGGGRSDSGGRGGFGSAVSNSIPILPIYSYNDPNRYFDPKGGLNTVAAANRSNRFVENKDYRAIASGFVDYQILKGLNIRSELSLDYIFNREHTYASEIIRTVAYANNNEQENWNRNYNIYASFNRSFGEHNLLAVAGYERQIQSRYRVVLSAENITSQDGEIGEPNLSFTDNSGQRYPNTLVMVVGTSPEFRIASTFGRVNYKFKEKYLLGFSIRRDGASVFGSENRFGIFPAVSAGWIASDEEFLKTFNQVNFLKVRASYGKTGNANIPDVLRDKYAVWPEYGVGSGVKIDNKGVPTLGWENITTFDAGVEFGLFNDRISGTVGYYNQKVSDMLLRTPVPLSYGLTADRIIWANVGVLRNTGFEFQVSTINLDFKGFKWSTNLNLSLNKNKIQDLTDELEKKGLGIFSGNTVSKKGGSLGTYYLAKYAGLNEQGDPLIYARDKKMFDSLGVTVPLKTAEGDDSLLIASVQNVGNNAFIVEGKTGLPTYFGGITNTFSFKGIELSVLVTFQGGNYIYDDFGRQQLNSTGGVIRQELVDNYWTEANTNAKYPRLTYQNRSADKKTDIDTKSDYYLEKGDFARLKTIQLAYSLPPSLLKKIGLQGLRIYVNGNNLFTATKFKGYDPEVANLNSTAENRNLQPAWIGGAGFPQLRSFNTGINVTF